MPKNGRINPDWENIKAAASKKRTGKTEVRPKSLNAGKISAVLSRQELVVQRLSAELTGKTPKYSPIGPREFVPYPFDDVTLVEIKNACISFFLNQDPTVKNSTCDVLATERGPSCNHVDQIPNLSLVHIRFVPKLLPPISSSFLAKSIFERSKPYRPPAMSLSLSFNKRKATALTETGQCTGSLTLSKMLKVGHEITNRQNLVTVELEAFNISKM